MSAIPTRTLARLCFDQGYYLKAAKIYRALLEEEPGSRELEASLSGVEEKIEHLRGAGAPEARRARLADLVDCWAGLVLFARRLEALGELRSELVKDSGG